MGSTTQSGSTQQQSEPWGPTQGLLKDMLGQIGNYSGNTGINPNENKAFNQLSNNAQKGNPFTGDMFGLANRLFAGGTDRTGMATNSLNAYRNQLGGYARGEHFGPEGNPQLKGYLDTIGNDVSSRVNGQFAAAGRDMSGMNQQTLARGMAEGMAPVLANQYNQDVQTQMGAANNLYGAGNSTTGLLAGLDQQKLGNQMAGIGVGNQALEARNYGANQTLSVEQMRRNLPLNNIQNILGMLKPVAGLGGSQTAITNQTMTPPIAMQAIQGISALGSMGGKG